MAPYWADLNKTFIGQVTSKYFHSGPVIWENGQFFCRGSIYIEILCKLFIIYVCTSLFEKESIKIFCDNFDKKFCGLGFYAQCIYLYSYIIGISKIN